MVTFIDFVIVILNKSKKVMQDHFETGNLDYVLLFYKLNTLDNLFLWGMLKIHIYSIKSETQTVWKTVLMHHVHFNFAQSVDFAMISVFCFQHSFGLETLELFGLLLFFMPLSSLLPMWSVFPNILTSLLSHVSLLYSSFPVTFLTPTYSSKCCQIFFLILFLIIL